MRFDAAALVEELARMMPSKDRPILARDRDESPKSRNILQGGPELFAGSVARSRNIQ
jgi:hypothetical protein